jgi:surface protein
MFYRCHELECLYVNYFNTSNVTNMIGMFGYCEKLTYLNLSSFDSSSVTDISEMFAYCESLKQINFSNFVRHKRISAMSTFDGCPAEVYWK